MYVPAPSCLRKISCVSPTFVHVSADSFSTDESDEAGFVKFFLAAKIEDEDD